MALKFEVRHFVEETNPAYHDQEGDSPYRLKITTLPTYGTLVKESTPLTEDEVLFISEASKLEYLRDEEKKEAHTDTFKFQIADIGSNRFSNIGTITINIGKIESAPTVDNNEALLTSKKYVFSTGSFINNFQDIDGDSYSIVTLKSLPTIPSLKYQGGNAQVGLSFNVEDSNDLSYNLPANYAVYDGTIYEFDKDIITIIFEAERAGYKLISNSEGKMVFGRVGSEHETITTEGISIDEDALCFKFTTSDDSTSELPSNEAEFCLNAQGNINVSTPYVNQPPTVGDNEFDTGHGGIINFDLDDFTTETSPAYSDSENDLPHLLKVESLPTDGTLFFNGVPVIVGQEIPVEEMENLTFKANIANENSHSVSFEYSIKDLGANEYSNTGTISINVGEKIANLPTVDDNSGILNNKIFTFGTGSFTNNFADADGDSYYEVLLVSTPLVPQLRLLGANASDGDRFLVSNSSGLKFHLSDNYSIYDSTLYKFNKSLDEIITDYDSLGYKITDNTSGTLTFTNLDDPSDEVTVQGTEVPNTSLQFTFRVTDNSDLNLESNTATFSLIPQGNVNVKPIYTNTPPIVGDNTITVQYNEVRTLEEKLFVEETDPEYYDAENDAPYELKVLTLPEYGQLLFNSSPVIENQIISFIDIREGRFKYAADNSRTDINNTKFDFAVSDIGSKTFSE